MIYTVHTQEVWSSFINQNSTIKVKTNIQWKSAKLIKINVNYFISYPTNFLIERIQKL